MVNANSPNIDLAVEFLALVEQPRERRRSSSTEAEIIPLATLGRSDAERRRTLARASVELLNDAPAVVLPPDTGYDLETANELYAAEAAVLGGQATPAEALADARRPPGPLGPRRAGRSTDAATRPVTLRPIPREARPGAIPPWLFLAPGARRVRRPRCCCRMVLTGGLQLHRVERLRADDVRGPRQLRPRARRPGSSVGSFVHVLIYIAATLVLEVVRRPRARRAASMRRGGTLVPRRHLHAGHAADGRRRGPLGVHLQPGLRAHQRRPRGGRARAAPAHLAGRPGDRAAGDQRRVGLGVRRLLHDHLLRRVPAGARRGHRGGAPRRRRRVGALPRASRCP